MSKRCLLLENIPDNEKLDLYILRHFISDKVSTPKPPKKEHLRCKVIRGHKRAIRQILNGKTPKATLHKFNIDDTRSLQMWRNLKDIIDRNPNFFINSISDDSGQKVDMQGNIKSISTMEKSFSFGFCINYFRRDEIRESYFYYIQLLFMNFDVKKLCEKFGFRCCKGESHKIMCVEKWIMLKEYLEVYMIRDLDLEPFGLDLNVAGLPSYANIIEFFN
ncbi:hypothetical protein SteCoe_26013 [Stentor coeruleus]|uniref:Uncharacterized protein n=1 Tax=Stentor coeruleus TaxID=5963 RepID=A0A1R2BDU9_9CILI|nr:hypothetical protein SteCoe_26013 [Stentor coeruleus]